ncbi:hypothetical protein F8Y90_07030 [Vibrio cholerae]|nr:hypothetical protein [Vibrio cholerae]
MIEIEESGVIFGPFDDDSLYKIEDSKHLPSHVKPVEFAWVPAKGINLVLVEAKSSFSNPLNSGDFDKNIQEIYTKIVDSLTVLTSSSLGRHPNIQAELPTKLRELNWERATINMRLVIPNFDSSWLPPITHALRKRLKHFLASLGIPEVNFQVLNKQIASSQGLLKETLEDDNS